MQSHAGLFQPSFFHIFHSLTPFRSRKVGADSLFLARHFLHVQLLNQNSSGYLSLKDQAVGLSALQSWTEMSQQLLDERSVMHSWSQGDAR